MKRSPPPVANDEDAKDPSLVPANKRRKPNQPDVDEQPEEQEEESLTDFAVPPPAKLEDEEDLPAGTFNRRRRLDDDDEDDDELNELDQIDDDRVREEVWDGPGTQAEL